MQKTPGRQGPIDDAFASGFICVIGSGETLHPATQKFVDAKLAAFKYDWAKHWRGELPTTDDYAVTPNEIMGKNLILFGDPSSNLTAGADPAEVAAQVDEGRDRVRGEEVQVVGACAGA